MRTEGKLAAVITMGLVVVVGLYWMYGAGDSQQVKSLSLSMGDALTVGSDPVTPRAGPTDIEPTPNIDSDADDRFASLDPFVPGWSSDQPMPPATATDDDALSASSGGQAEDESDRRVGSDRLVGPRHEPRSAFGITTVDREGGGPSVSPNLAQSDATTAAEGAMPDMGSTELRSLPEVSGAEQAYDRHIAQSGESFRSISQMFFGSERYADYLAETNPTIDVTATIPVGKVVLIPPDPADDGSSVGKGGSRRSRRGSKTGATKLSQASPTTSDATRSPSAASRVSAGRRPRTYVVKSGDTFFGISRALFGSPKRWEELLELNSHLVGGDPKKLRPGQELILPEA